MIKYSSKEAQGLTIAQSQCIEVTQLKYIYRDGFPLVASLALAVAII